MAGFLDIEFKWRMQKKICKVFISRFRVWDNVSISGWHVCCHRSKKHVAVIKEHWHNTENCGRGCYTRACTCIHVSHYTKLYSFRLSCRIVSLTAANTNRIFSVSEKTKMKILDFSINLYQLLKENNYGLKCPYG